MPQEQRSKADWLDQIEREQAEWEALLTEVGPERMAVPGAAGDWTFKDVAAHLNGWRVRTVARLEAAARGQEPPPPHWPAEYDDDTDEGVEAINRWMYEQDRNRSADEILAQSRDQFRRMRDAVAAVPEADLLQPGRYPWLGDYPLSEVVNGTVGHLHEEHEPAIRAWLAGLDAR
jgi:hypothetical protein